MIYLICFSISIALCYFSNKPNITKKRKIILSVLSILVPSILAGLRDTSIGTDVAVYVQPSFDVAFRYSSFSQYSDFFALEYLFKLITFIITKLFGDINVLLFVYHLIICSTFYIGAYLHRKKASPTIIYSLFLLLYYNMSLNIMRQFLALGFIFISFKYIEEQKLIKFLILLLVATLFHNSAILTIFIYFIYYISKKKNRLLYSVALVSLIVVIIVNYNNILSVLTTAGIIDPKYIRYSMDYSESNLSVFDTIAKIFTLFLTIFQIKLLKKEEDNFYFTLMCILDLIILQIGVFSPNATRISLYFGIFSLINISRIITISRTNKIPLTMIVYSFYIFYFYYVYILGGACETYPYVLGI